MYPRTLFLERPFYLLRDQLNSPCIEIVSPVQEGKLKLKIVNRQNLSLQEYFNKRKFKCIYDKLEGIKTNCRTFIGRTKPIDFLIDYNWKDFKSLELEIGLLEKEDYDAFDSDFESGNICKVFAST